MLFTAPPSTRSAAPVVADGAGAAEIDREVRDLLGAAKRCVSEAGRALRKNSALISACGLPDCRPICSRNPLTPRDRVGPGRKALTVTPGKLDGKPARDGELRRLGHALMDHLARDVERALAGDEEDATPACAHIAGA